MLIIYQLAGGPLRFSDLKRSIPDISEKMLIQELKTLADSDLVYRQNFGEVPPRVEYRLSDRGQAALPLVDAMAQFADHYLAEK